MVATYTERALHREPWRGISQQARSKLKSHAEDFFSVCLIFSIIRGGFQGVISCDLEGSEISTFLKIPLRGINPSKKKHWHKLRCRQAWEELLPGFHVLQPALAWAKAPMERCEALPSTRIHHVEDNFTVLTCSHLLYIEPV